MKLYSIIGVNGNNVDCYKNGKKVSKPCYLVNRFRIMDIETTEFFDIDIEYLRSIESDLMLDNRLSKLIFVDNLVVSDSNIMHYKVEDDDRYEIKRESSLLKYGICFVNGKLIPKIKESDFILYSREVNGFYGKAFYPFGMEVFNCILYRDVFIDIITCDHKTDFVICSTGEVGYTKDGNKFYNDKFDKLMEDCFSSDISGMLKLDNTYILDCSDIKKIDSLMLPSDCVALYYFTNNVIAKVKNIVFPPSCVVVASRDMLDSFLDIGSCYISNLVDDNVKNSLIRWVTECGCKDINFY